MAHILWDARVGFWGHAPTILTSAPDSRNHLKTPYRYAMTTRRQEHFAATLIQDRANGSYRSMPFARTCRILFKPALRFHLYSHDGLSSRKWPLIYPDLGLIRIYKVQWILGLRPFFVFPFSVWVSAHATATDCHYEGCLMSCRNSELFAKSHLYADVT